MASMTAVTPSAYPDIAQADASASSRPGVRGAQAGDPGRRHLRANGRDPPGRAPARRRARGIAHADPGGDDAARAGGLPANRAAPRCVHRPQDEEADHRNDRDVGSAREHGGAPRDRERDRRRDRRAAHEVRRVPHVDTGRAHPRVLGSQHRVPSGDHPAVGLAPHGQDDREPVRPRPRDPQDDDLQSDRAARSIVDHMEIIEALERRDTELAERLVRQHSLDLAAHVDKHCDFSTDERRTRDDRRIRAVAQARRARPTQGPRCRSAGAGPGARAARRRAAAARPPDRASAPDSGHLRLHFGCARRRAGAGNAARDDRGCTRSRRSTITSTS